MSHCNYLKELNPSATALQTGTHILLHERLCSEERLEIRYCIKRHLASGTDIPSKDKVKSVMQLLKLPSLTFTYRHDSFYKVTQAANQLTAINDRAKFDLSWPFRARLFRLIRTPLSGPSARALGRS